MCASPLEATRSAVQHFPGEKYVAAGIDRVEVVRDPEVEELEELYRKSPSDDHSAGPSTEATLSVTRNAPDDVQDRAVNLWLDGESWDLLRYGATLTRAIPAGRHTLKAHNTLFGAELTFDAVPGEHVRVRCTNSMTGSGMLLMMLIGWAMLRVKLERE